MDAKTRLLNAKIASRIGIQHIELQHSIDRVARQIMGLVTKRMVLSLDEKTQLFPITIKYNMDIIYWEIERYFQDRAEKIIDLYLKRVNAAISLSLEESELVEAKKKYLPKQSFFPNVSKNEILKIIKGEEFSKRVHSRMAKRGLTSASASALAIAQNNMELKKSVIQKYFTAIKNSVYNIARTAMSSASGRSGKIAYKGLPKNLIGFQVHGILDDRIRPKHLERNGTVYYKKPRYGNKGLDEMPNPPLEEDGSIAYNCRCWLTPVVSTDTSKFYDFKGRIIPDAKIFNNWFSTSTKDRQIMAIGVKRFNAASKRLSKGERLSWWHILDPESGMLLDEKTIKSESPQKRVARLKKAKKVISGA